MIYFSAIIFLFTGYGIIPCSLVMLLQTLQANVVVFEHLLKITQRDTNYCAVIGLIFYWAYILNFCFSFFWAVPALRPGGIAPHLVPLIWLVILALHLDHSLAKLTATCVLPRNNPKQIQTNPCAISEYWSTTVQDLALKTRIFSAIS